MARLTKKQEREQAEALARFEAECQERSRKLKMNCGVTREALESDGEPPDVVAVALEGVGLGSAYDERDRARGRIELCRIRALELRLSARFGNAIESDHLQAIENAAPPEERDAARLARVSRWFDRFARQDLDKRATVDAVLRGEESNQYLREPLSPWGLALS